MNKATIGGLALLSAALLLANGAKGATETVIYSFAGDDDGEYTDTDLVVDAAGNLYGTSVLGGEFGGGTVWQLSPVGDGWVHTVLYSFTGGADGGEPYKGVTLDKAGNLYGTAVTGGSGTCEGGCGVTYQLTKSGDNWTQTVIHAFTGKNDGSGPGSRVTVDKRGHVYGMTPTGGAFGLGTIYVLRPKANGGWALRVIHTFTGGDDGSSGSAGKMLLRGGKIYGAATTGGANGAGTVFALTPTATGEWDFKTLYAFQGAPDGVFPYGALLFDGAGNIYGTTYYGGTDGLGAVYRLSPNDSGEWEETVLYSFQPGNDGNSSISNLVADAAGNLYGTTSEGGLGSGTIFKLAPRPDGSWSESVVHSFAGSPDGAFPYAGMVEDGTGNFFGATVHGGDDGEGAIYKFVP
ncbi:MAG: choice-of-anchor tandem repeat GloVer-containing protein [Chthoniobacterales bacterium]